MFMLSQFSASKAKEFLYETKKINISIRNIHRFFKEIRKVLYNYYLIQYNLDSFQKRMGIGIIQ